MHHNGRWLNANENIIEANLVIYLTHLPLVYLDGSHHWWHQTSWVFAQLLLNVWGIFTGFAPSKWDFPGNNIKLIH